MTNQVCLPKTHAWSYVILLILLTVFITTTFVLSRNETLTNVNLSAHLSRDQLQQKLLETQDTLYQTQRNYQVCEKNLYELQRVSTPNRLLDKIYNPLVSPERIYPGHRTLDFQLIGYLYSDSERFPLFGRHRYPGRSDKWEYYAIDETRNRVKLPLTNKNFNELYDGDTTTIPTVQGTFRVKLYDYEQLRYNPNL